MSSELSEEKRGIKRTLDDVESSTITTMEPNPKRRKLSTENHIILSKNDDNEKNENNNKFESNSNQTNNPMPTTNNNNNDIQCNTKINKKITQIPNATNNKNNNAEPQKPKPPQMQLIDVNTPSHSPPTNNHSNTNHTSPDIAMKPLENTPSNTLSQSNQSNFVSIIRPSADTNKFYDYLSIYTDERCLIHAIPDKQIENEFNERPARLQALIQMVRDEQWNKHSRFIPSLDDCDVPSLPDIEGLHTKSYLTELKNSCSKMSHGNWSVSAGSDTYIVKDTLGAALISAGLVMEATKFVFSHIPPLPFAADTPSNHSINMDANGNGADSKQKKTALTAQSTDIIADDAERKYAAVLNRPPGHHCDGEKYSGYCYINNIAVAIEKQLNQDTKVLVLDIDVHHGDGTQKLFYAEPTVLTVSFHQYDGSFFPSSGLRTSYGPSRRHPAYGTNINVPLDDGASDLDVLYALRNMVWNIVDKFKPDIAFYALGTDGVANDKANNSTIFTPSLYGQIAYELREYVKLIVVTTEGGYTTDYLASGMSAALHGLTAQIDVDHYPSELKQCDILPATIHNVAATISDLRRVYDFEQDPNEIRKIFSGYNDSFSRESMYIPNDMDYNESDSDMHDMDMEDMEMAFSEEVEVKKDKKSKGRKHRKHRKHKKRDKDRIDLTEDKERKKKKKKKKKHKKHRKDKEKRSVSKCVDRKQRKERRDGKEIEIIDLIEDSPMADININVQGNGATKKKKKKKKKHRDKNKHRDKDKDRKKKKKKAKINDNENKSDINNVAVNKDENESNKMCTLSNIIGNGVSDLLNIINQDKSKNNDKISSDIIVIE